MQPRGDANRTGARSIPEQLEQDGFAIVLEVLSPGTTQGLTIEITEMLSKGTRALGYAMRHLVQRIPGVRRVAASAAIRNLVEPVLGSQAFVARSLLLDKTPDANWKVAWHQDLTIAVQARTESPGFHAWSVKDGVVHVQPPAAVLERMLTVRLHLDDCDSANAPLQVMLGSHRSGRLNPREIAEWRDRAPVRVCIVPRGGALLMRPLLLHASSSASEPSHRRVIQLEFAAESLPGGLQWLR